MAWLVTSGAAMLRRVVGRDTPVERFLRRQYHGVRNRTARRHPGPGSLLLWGPGPSRPRIGIYMEGSCALESIFRCEPLIRQTVKATLERHGYRVLAAEDGDEAVTLHGRHEGEISAVLLDMMMPGMDGPETLAALRLRDPNLRVITSSGLPLTKWANESVGVQPDTFLPKPYTDEQLLAALTDVLHAF